MIFRNINSSAAVLLLLAISFCLSIQAHGQVAGVVVDESGEPVEGILVAALSAPDSLYVNGTVTDSIGTFALPVNDNVKNFILRAEGIGYEPVAMTVSSGDKVRIVLAENSLTLGEVSVEASRLQFNRGRFVFLPGNLSEYATDGFNLMQYVPLLRTNRMSDELSILGKDKTQILVNGKEPVAGNYGTIKLLKVADPARIKKVEIIMNPSIGRRDGGAIINIVLAPQTGNVLTADVYGMLKNGRVSSRQQVFYYGEYNRWQFSASFHANENNDKTERVLFYDFLPSDDTPESTQETHLDNKKNDIMLAASVGGNLDLLHNNSVGFKVSYDRWNQHTDSHTFVEYLPQNATVDFTSYFRAPGTNVANISFNYDHSLDTLGTSFWATANLFLYDGQEQYYYTPGADMSANRLPKKQNSIKATAQFNKEIGDFSWVLGAKGYRDRLHYLKYDSFNESLESAQRIVDNFLYLQSQVDLYTSLDYSDDFGSYRIGLTGRWYSRDIDQKLMNLKHGFDRFYALPSASVSLSFNSNNYLSLSYAMDLEHPMYYLVDPIVEWSRPTAYFSGNPYLKSVKVNTLSLTYLFFRHFVIGGSADFRSNIAQVVAIPEEGGIIHSTPLETGRATIFRPYISYNNSFFKYRWNVSGTVRWVHRHYSPSKEYSQYANGMENSSQWVFALSSSVTLGRNRDWEIEASLNSESPLHQPYYNSGWNNILVLYANKDFGEKFSLSLQFYNILNSSPSSWNYASTYRSINRRIDNQRSVMLRLDISLGKSFRKRDMGSRGGLGGF